MVGNLTTPIGGISLCLPPPCSTGFTSKMACGGRSYKASFHTVVGAMRPESLYEVLRVERNATHTEIKTAYRNLAKVYHPDASDEKEEGDHDFIEIHKAYATLSDPDARATYDLMWSTGIRGRSGSLGKRRGLYSSRRWETDQCW